LEGWVKARLEEGEQEVEKIDSMSIYRFKVSYVLFKQLAETRTAH
jgi:hypothetical protein